MRSWRELLSEDQYRLGGCSEPRQRLEEAADWRESTGPGGDRPEHGRLREIPAG
jgi:hypothetical protein